MEMRSPVMWVFLMWCIFGHIIISHKNDFVEAKSFSKFEDLEIQKRLNTINKPAVKIIKTIDGERYGCVDFFKQPAFDHPSMKNHEYNDKTHPIWKHMRERQKNSTGFGYLWENGVGCPSGTVPIQRVTKDDLMRLDSFGDDHKPRGSWNFTNSYDPNSVVHYDKHHYAVARTLNVEIKFHGATMELSVTAPKVRHNQYSASRLHIQMGRDFIQTGFTVNPVLYKDTRPRIFVYTNSGGKSCYNTNCNVGMLLVRQDFALDSPFLPVSIRGAKTSHCGIFGLIKDQKNGNWWFEFGDKGDEVGFWPSNRFHQSFGNLVEWGGEAYSASLPSPEMGFGHFPVEHMAYDGHMKRISILGDNYDVDRTVMYTEKFSDDTRGYRVIDDTDTPKYPHFGHMIFYGGPGNI